MPACFSTLAHGALLMLAFSALPLGACMAAGLVSALLQAATQVQEQTLSFVPKLAAVGLLLYLTGAWMWGECESYLLGVFAQLPALGPPKL